MGTAWTVLAFVVTSLVGVTAGVALQSLGVLTHPFWTTPEDGAPAAGLSTPVVGALLTASAFAGPLWRRRIRLLVLSGSVIVLCSTRASPATSTGCSRRSAASCSARSSPGSARCSSGRAARTTRRAASWPRSSPSARSGPFVAVLVAARIRAAPAARPALPGPAAAAAARSGRRCRLLHPAAGCARDIALARLNGPGAVLLTVLPLLVLLRRRVRDVAGPAPRGAGRDRGQRPARAARAASTTASSPRSSTRTSCSPAPAARGPTPARSSRCGVPAVVAVAVLVQLRHFDVLPHRAVRRAGSSSRRWARWSATAVLYVALGLLLRAQFSPHVGLLDLLLDLPRALRAGRLPAAPDGWTSCRWPRAQVLEGWTGPVAWFVVLVGVVVGGRLPGGRPSGGPGGTAAAILHRGSQRVDLGHMGLWPGNRYWFCADGRTPSPTAR